jgi:RNA polymerase sigma factor (sigma-70 family)
MQEIMSNQDTMTIPHSFLSYEERMELYENHKHIIPILIYRFRIPKYYSGVDKDDLQIVAEIALWNATRLFDPSNGAQFLTYAWHHVLGALKHEVRDYSRLIRIPGWYKEKNPTFEIEIIPLEDNINFEFEGSVKNIHDVDTNINIDILFSMFLDEVPNDYHDGLLWFLQTVFDDKSQEEIADSEKTSLRNVSRQIRLAKKILYESEKIQQWAGCRKNTKTYIPTSSVEIVDINPSKCAKDSAKKVLNPIELRILALIGVGRTDKEVAEKIGISINTIRNQLNSIYRKFNCDNRDDCFAMAFEI